ncbi:MFS transporter [Burkholderiaceae bacterium DAT-1]|nr:MFS transporter [Burkholderiaceae bacterium DAT-1]
MSHLNESSVARREYYAVLVLFFLLGVVYATWSARVPALRDALDLSPGALGTVLLGGGIGSVLSFPVSAFALARLGARKTALCSGAALLIVLVSLAIWPSWPLLMFGLLLSGVCASVFDVAINAMGAVAEKHAGRSIMSTLHAWFCVGTFAGALIGSAAAGSAISPLVHFAVVAAALYLPLAWAFRNLPSDEPDAARQSSTFVMPHGALILVGVIAFLGAISEGSLSSWIALFMRDAIHSGEAAAPLGYAVFAASMLLARLAGDKVRDSKGAGFVVGVGSLVAALGLLVAAVSSSFGMACAGFVAAGIGIAGVFPCIFSVAGKEGPAAIAAVATLGYSGGLMGPPVMGAVVASTGLRGGMIFLALVSMTVALTAMRARLLR